MTEPKGSNFWATLPGLVTAIAGMITAIAILITTLATLPIGDQTVSSPPSPSVQSSGGPSPADSPAATGEPSPSAAQSGSAESPSAPPSSRAILFYAVRVDPETSQENADLYSVDPITGAERRLTTDAPPDSYPVWSPDGTRIAFDSRRANGNRNIWVLEAGGSFTALTNDARDDGYATWSPDGTQLAWAAGPAGDREIWVMDADGGNTRRLTTGADDYLPSWSATGLIAFERRVSGGSEIWVVDPAGGGAAARITIADGGGGDPAWSPDGRQLAFTRRAGEIDRVFMVSADGQSGLAELTPAGSCDCDEPTWSPDGTQVAYVGPGSGVIRPIMIVDVAGGTPRRITTNGLAPSWAG